ncbi:UPF0310 protein [Trichinella pseudospiralis]
MQRFPKCIPSAYKLSAGEDCSCSRGYSLSVFEAIRTLRERSAWSFRHFYPVRMDESSYNVSIQWCSIQDVHQQPEWPSTSILLHEFFGWSIYTVTS